MNAVDLLRDYIRHASGQGADEIVIKSDKSGNYQLEYRRSDNGKRLWTEPLGAPEAFAIAQHLEEHIRDQSEKPNIVSGKFVHDGVDYHCRVETSELSGDYYVVLRLKP